MVDPDIVFTVPIWRAAVGAVAGACALADEVMFVVMNSTGISKQILCAAFEMPDPVNIRYILISNGLTLRSSQTDGPGRAAGGAVINPGVASLMQP
jgi:hypothetical protein